MLVVSLFGLNRWSPKGGLSGTSQRVTKLKGSLSLEDWKVRYEKKSDGLNYSCIEIRHKFLRTKTISKTLFSENSQCFSLAQSPRPTRAPFRLHSFSFPAHFCSDSFAMVERVEKDLIF